MRRPLFAFVLISFFTNQLHGQGNTEKSIKLFEYKIDSIMSSNTIPGMAIAVSQNGRLIWSMGYGLADVEQKVMVDPANTKFRIASISKALTSIGLGILLEEKRIHLDSSIYFYLPDYPLQKYRPTVRQLASHTGGIRHYRGNENESTLPYATVWEGLSIFSKDSLMYKPGTQFLYSSYGFNLLSAVMEKSSGINFLDFMKQRVLEPLNMNSTLADHPDQIIPGRGRYYTRQGTNAPYVDNSYKWAGGGYVSTATDLLKLGQAMIDGAIIKPETIHELITSQKLHNGKETGYGLGWFSGNRTSGQRWFGHSGGAVGGSSNLVIYPEQKLVVVILTNVSGADIGGFTHQIAGAFLTKR